MAKLTKCFGIALVASSLLVTPALFSAPGDAAFAQGKSAEHAGGNGNSSGGNNSASSNTRASGNGNASENGNAGGNSNATNRANGSAGGNAGGNGNGQGAGASILQGLNAYKANPNAASNANPNSQVGRIAAYVEASAETGSAYEAWKQAYNEYLTFKNSYEGPSLSELEVLIESLDTESETYKADLTALQAQVSALEAYEVQTATLAQVSNSFAGAYDEAKQAQDEALQTAAGDRALSAEEEQLLRDALGLDSVQ